MDRFKLLDWLEPHCEPEMAALLYPKGDKGLSPGWVNSEQDVGRAVAAYRRGRVSVELFRSQTQTGKSYKTRQAERLGLVPHRDGLVTIFCIDLDDHNNDGGNVHLLAQLETFLGAEPIVFTSKGGRGLHCFFRLATPCLWPTLSLGLRLWASTARGNRSCCPRPPSRRRSGRHVGLNW